MVIVKVTCFDFLIESPAVKTKCTFNVATGKLVIVNDKCIGARKDFNGIYLLDSILQPPQEDPNAPIVLELPLNQVPNDVNMTTKYHNVLSLHCILVLRMLLP